eukprot:GEMP01071773.1.p1 GENE.GEMP01071773.1~~GEMP01071773.1.p1  ORF type:complete len:307 (+),score=83.35 GEMP01071773.1:162-1082(+)
MAEKVAKDMSHIVQRRLPWSVRKRMEGKLAEPTREIPAIVQRITKCAHQRPHGPRSRQKVLWGNLAHQVVSNRVELNAEDLCTVLVCFAKPHVATNVPLNIVDQIIDSLARTVGIPPPALANVLPAVEFLRPELSAELKAQLLQMLIGQCAELSFVDLTEVLLGLSKLQNRATINQDFLDELFDTLAVRLETDPSIDPVKCFVLPHAVITLGKVQQPQVLRVIDLLAHLLGNALASRLNVKLRDALNSCDAFGGPYMGLARKLHLYCAEELRQLTDEQLIGMDRDYRSPSARKLVNAEFARRGLGA